MICAKCGANNPDMSAYCGACGLRLAPEPVVPPIVTPNNTDAPTLHVVPPVQEQVAFATPAEGASPPFSMPEAAVPPFPQTPFPSENIQFGSVSLQNPPTVDANAASFPQPLASGTYPNQGATPVAPQSFPSGAYPPVMGSGTQYPGEAYPGAALASGAYYNPTAPMPGGQVSGTYPNQISQPSWAGYPGQFPPPAAQNPSGLIKPLPLWIFLASIVLVAVVLVLLMLFGGSDWAAGAQTAGVVALVIGALILVAFGVRSALGMLAKTNVHRRSQIVSAVLLALLVFAFGTLALTQQSSVHALQARYLEGQQKWQMAITEYQDSGQGAPTSVDIARMYNNWGEQLAGQKQYNDALDKFNTVITDYSQAGNEVSRAKRGAASGYFNLAELALSAQKYSDAVTAFNQLSTNFSDSPLVKQAHPDYAKALWGQGQQELTTSCTSALTVYQQLASQFSDTSEGQQATSALKQPQSVKGHFTGSIPGGTNTPEVGLVQGVSASMSSNAFYALLAKSPVVTVHGDGTFEFTSINQGNYDLVWGVVNTTAGQEVFRVGQRYPATVGPLCAFDFGDISEDFPTA